MNIIRQLRWKLTLSYTLVTVSAFLVVLLIVLWLLGVITKYTLGGLLHILLVIAIIFLLIGVIRGRGV